MSNDYPQAVRENGFSTIDHADQPGQEHVDVQQPLYIDVGHVVADQPADVQVNAEAHEMLLLQEAPGPINGDHQPPPVLEAQNSLEVSSCSTASTYLLSSSASGQPDASAPGPSSSATQTLQPQAKSSLEALEESSEVSELTSSSGPEDNLRRRSREEDSGPRHREEEIDRGRKLDSDCRTEQRGEVSETTTLLPRRTSSAFVRRLQACMPYLRYRGCWLAAITLVPGSLFLLWYAEIIPSSVLFACFILIILVILIPLILSYRFCWL